MSSYSLEIILGIISHGQYIYVYIYSASHVYLFVQSMEEPRSLQLVYALRNDAFKAYCLQWSIVYKLSLRISDKVNDIAMKVQIGR